MLIIRYAEQVSNFERFETSVKHQLNRLQVKALKYPKNVILFLVRYMQLTDLCQKQKACNTNTAYLYVEASHVYSSVT